MTQEQIRRVCQAIAETEKQIAREESYAPQFQDASAIAGYKAHLAKLLGML